MTNYTVKNVDEFIAASPAIAHPHLQQLRELVKSVVPDAEERISYGKPYYKYHGYMAGFDVYTHHIGFEFWTNTLPTTDREALEEKGYKTGSRTFQIRYDQKVPTVLLKKMVNAQARVNELNAKV